MTGPAKIAFDHRRARLLDDINDLVEMMFPGKRAQQYTAARLLLRLEATRGVVGSFHDLETDRGMSRRTLQRTRAKLARLGLIERVTWMNSRYGGRNGWKLSGRMSAGLRALADRIDQWRHDTGPIRKAKEEALAELLRPTERSLRPQARVCVTGRDSRIAGP